MEEDKMDEIAANEREENEISIASDKVNESEGKGEDRVAVDETTTSDKNENKTAVDRVTMDEITNEMADKNRTLVSFMLRYVTLHCVSDLFVSFNEILLSIELSN